MRMGSLSSWPSSFCLFEHNPTHTLTLHFAFSPLYWLFLHYFNKYSLFTNLHVEPPFIAHAWASMCYSTNKRSLHSISTSCWWMNIRPSILQEVYCFSASVVTTLRNPSPDICICDRGRNFISVCASAFISATDAIYFLYLLLLH